MPSDRDRTAERDAVEALGATGMAWPTAAPPRPTAPTRPTRRPSTGSTASTTRPAPTRSSPAASPPTCWDKQNAQPPWT